MADVGGITDLPHLAVADNIDSGLALAADRIGDAAPDHRIELGRIIVVAAILRKHLPNAVIDIGPGLNFLGLPYPMHGVYDISRAQQELGYRPEFDLERGIADYLESLQRLKLQAA